MTRTSFVFKANHQAGAIVDAYGEVVVHAVICATANPVGKDLAEVGGSTARVAAGLYVRRVHRREAVEGCPETNPQVFEARGIERAAELHVHAAGVVEFHESGVIGGAPVGVRRGKGTLIPGSE